MRIAFALYGEVAGLIERDAGRTTLTYLPEYRDAGGRTPLSLSMPVAATTYTARPVDAYLKGLLPDHHEVRRRWARKAGVRDGDTLGLVAHVGLDVAGGAVFAPEDSIAEALTTPGSLQPASESDIAARLRRVRQDAAAWREDEDDEPWSLAGAQSKFTLAQTAEGWAFAEGAAPSTHIVKPGIGRIRAQALSEHVSMRALDLVGLPVAQSRYLTFEDQDAIVVTRFDRRRDAAGDIVRVHQEDLVQAFGMDPARKYEADRGPGVARIASLIRAVGGPDSVARFARAVIANQILGAPDAHGKNYSLLLVGSAASLTPLYDVATGLIPDDHGQLRYGKGAMSIGGERRFGDVERNHWERFANTLGIPPHEVIGWVEELATAIPDAFRRAAHETPAPDTDLLAGPVAGHIAAVAQQTLRNLTTTRRRGGRLVEPFLQSLPGQGRARAATMSNDTTGRPGADDSWGN